MNQYYFLTAEGSRLPDYQLKDVEVVVGAHGGYKVVHIPIVPLRVGPLEVAAKIVRSEDVVVARTRVVHEGLRREVFR